VAECAHHEGSAVLVFLRRAKSLAVDRDGLQRHAAVSGPCTHFLLEQFGIYPGDNAP
jgi:hypothetical protein